MPRFHTILELHEYLHYLISLGFGSATPLLDRRGCDCRLGKLALADPGKGERISLDGSRAYISTRLME